MNTMTAMQPNTKRVARIWMPVLLATAIVWGIYATTHYNLLYSLIIIPIHGRLGKFLLKWWAI